MNKTVVVAMSGGVDSSVAAALLHEQGYQVVGMTMRLANWESREGRTFGGCCGSKDFYDARSVAQSLGIPHYSYDYVETFKVSVINSFKESYLKGETPNPCIECNQHIKFDALLKHAIALGADYLATGHYARVAATPDGYELHKASDHTKDQSYVLYGLGQAELQRILFPLGSYRKTEIRELARRHGLKTADKPDSYEICFVPNEDYKQFIEEEVPMNERPTGPIRHKDGRVLGQHRGLPFYTIGQREGLGISVGHPLYVVSLETATNTLVVGEKPDVYSQQVPIRDLSWVAGVPPVMPLQASVKIRSKHTEARATLASPPAPLPQGEGGRRPGEAVLVTFAEPQSAITPGQAAVFYLDDKVLGGGVIDHANNN